MIVVMIMNMIVKVVMYSCVMDDRGRGTCELDSIALIYMDVGVIECTTHCICFENLV